MSETRALITGANGFLGRAMADRLAATRPDWRVSGVDVTPPALIPGEMRDLSDPEQAVSAVREARPNVVFHLAGATAGEWECLYERNVRTTIALLDAVAAVAPDAAVVVPGSAAEYGDLPWGKTAFTEDDLPAPRSPYGVVKSWQTTTVSYAARCGVHACVGRIFNIVGPGIPDTFLAGRVARQLADPHVDELRVRSLAGRRDLVDVRDVCDALVALATAGRPGAVYNVCSGIGVEVAELVRAMVAASGHDVRLVEEAGVETRAGIGDSVGSIRRIADATGWSPVIRLEQSIQDLLASVKEA